MKTRSSFFVLTLIASVAFFACKKEDRISPNNTSSVIKDGNWRVSSFVDDGKDETYHFSGYTFDFNNGSSVTAIKDGVSTNGSWSAGKDDSHTEIVISFPSVPLNELNEDWHVIKQSANSIELQHVSGGNGGTDNLHFEKN